MATVDATYFEDRIWVRWQGGDFEEMLHKAKSVAGARFHKESKSWRYPASVDTCKDLRRAFGSDLVLSPEIKAFYIAEMKGREAQVKNSAATDAELQNLPGNAPALASALRPDQRAGVAWCAQPYRGSGIVADEPGLGKTLEMIGGILERDPNGPILVICPKISVYNVWFYELRRWTNESVHIARGTRAQRQKAIREFVEDPSERKWLVIVAEMLRVERRAPKEDEPKSNAKKRGRIEGFSYPELFDYEWESIIVDESHKLLGSLTVSKANLAGEGLTKLRLAPGGTKYALSGTPFGKGGRVQGMFGTLHWLWPDEYTSFWRWAERYFNIEEQFIARGKTAKKIGGLREGVGEEQFLEGLGPRILRRRKAEVLPNLPPKQYAEVLCEMTPLQKKQYKMLGDDAEIVLPGGGVLTADGVLAEITRAKQIANGAVTADGEGGVDFTTESGKVDALLEKLEARGISAPGTENGTTKVVIASRFNNFLKNCVQKRLEEEGIEYYKIDGSTSEKKRNAQMQSFQNDKNSATVMVIQSNAAGISINLDAADELHMMDELDNPEDNIQVEDRIHRASRDHKVTVYNYRTEGTIDTNTRDRVEDKRQQQYVVLDGRRGLADIRNVIKFKEVK